MEGPRRLNWGKRPSQGASRPSTSDAGQQQDLEYAIPQAALLVRVGGTGITTAASTDSAQHPFTLGQCPDVLLCGAANSTISRDKVKAVGETESGTAAAEAQMRRSVLREVLAAVLQADGPQLDHYQLTVQAVTAVVAHQVTVAACKARNEATTAAAAAAKEQLVAGQSAAETKAAKLAEDAAAKAAALAAQHTQEVAKLQAQLTMLQRENRQLFGKAAQHTRNARQAAVSAEESQNQLEQLRQQVQKQQKQLDIKDAALAKCKAAAQQEAACLSSALQQAAAETDTAASAHEQQVKQLQQQHAATIAIVKASVQADAERQLQGASAAHHQQLLKQEQAALKHVKSVMEQLQLELVALYHQQQQELQRSNAALSCLAQQQGTELRQAHAVVQQVHAEFAAIQQQVFQAVAWSQQQHASLLQLQQQLAEAAPEGLQALRQQAETARHDHAAALQQLQETSMQLSTLKPAMLKLQQEKQDLLKDSKAASMAAADAQSKLSSVQQQLEATSSQLQQAQADLVHSNATAAALQFRLQELQASSQVQPQSTGTGSTQQQQEEMTKLQQQLTAAADGQQHLLQQLQHHLGWLCDAYLRSAPSAGLANTRQADCSPRAGSVVGTTGDSVSSNGSISNPLGVDVLDPAIGSGNGQHHGSPELSQHNYALHVGGNTSEELMYRYEQYMQHKQHFMSGQVDWSSHVTAGAVPVDAQAIWQQVLRLEACLLQQALQLQEWTQRYRKHLQKQQQQQQQMAAAGSGIPISLQRPGTASSRHTDWSVGSVSSRGSGDLTGQLLQAMAKEKRQLTAELRKLQGKQEQQRHSPTKGYVGGVGVLGCIGSSAWPFAPVHTAHVAFMSHDAHPSSAEDVDELLQLLHGADLNGHSRITASTAVNGPSEGQNTSTTTGQAQQHISAAPTTGMSSPAQIAVEDPGSTSPTAEVTTKAAAMMVRQAPKRWLSTGARPLQVQRGSLLAAGVAANAKSTLKKSSSMQSSSKQRSHGIASLDGWTR